jgi:hypothetical protein
VRCAKSNKVIHTILVNRDHAEYLTHYCHLSFHKHRPFESFVTPDKPKKVADILFEHHEAKRKGMYHSALLGKANEVHSGRYHISVCHLKPERRLLCLAKRHYLTTTTTTTTPTTITNKHLIGANVTMSFKSSSSRKRLNSLLFNTSHHQLLLMYVYM